MYTLSDPVDAEDLHIDTTPAKDLVRMDLARTIERNCGEDRFAIYNKGANTLEVLCERVAAFSPTSPCCAFRVHVCVARWRSTWE